MTPDEARNLLGGYATGSLTEAERKALFAAALEDQELFEELAGQQVLKEVLDEPGARQRLIAALEPPRHRAWLWVTAAATLAIVVGVVVVNRSQPPQQIAQITKSEVPVAAPTAPPPPVKPNIAPAPAPQPPPELQKKEEALADKIEEAKPAPPAPEQEAAQARGGGGRGGRAVGGFAAEPAAAAALRSENLAVSGFGFNYAIRADGFLEIVPLAPGFLSVATSARVIFPSGAVSAGMPVRIPIPADSASLVVSFSRTPAVTGSPVRRDDASGTVTDQDPPNGRIVIELFLKPAPR